MSLLLALVLAGGPSLPYGQERQLLTRRLDALRRILPDGPQPTADVAHLADLARGAGATGLVFQARAPLESGARGDLIVEVTGAAAFLDVDRFFRQAALSPRLVDVERLELLAARDGLVQVVAALRMPYRPTSAPLPRPPEGLPPAPAGTLRGDADAFVRDQSVALAKVEEIARLRRDRRNPRLFLSELASVVRDRPVVLQGATFADELQIRGFALGEGSMRALESRLTRGFFRISDVLMTRNGACHQFEARGRVPVVGPDAEIPVAHDDPFRHEDEPCRVDRDPPARLVIRPAKPQPGRATGPLTVRTRGVDAADVFQVLSVVAGTSYLVDGDVAGRADLDLSRVTEAEVLDLLDKAGVHTSTIGPFRRVSRDALLPALFTPPELPDGAPLASLALKRAQARAVLDVLAAADPAAPPVPAAGGTISVWTREVPVPLLRGALLRVIAGTPAPTGPPPRRLGLRPDEITWTEITLAALASAEGQPWTAFAYTPSGALQPYRVGDRLADAVVTEVTSTDLLLETDDGAVRIPLPMPTR